MMRLIDADNAKEWFKGGILYMYSDDVLNRIDHCPTIDAVPVVRCKDCKHQIEKGYAQYRYKWCNAWSGINGMGDDGFCNYGELKEGEP